MWNQRFNLLLLCLNLCWLFKVLIVSIGRDRQHVKMSSKQHSILKQKMYILIPMTMIKHSRVCFNGPLVFFLGSWNSWPIAFCLWVSGPLLDPLKLPGMWFLSNVIIIKMSSYAFIPPFAVALAFHSLECWHGGLQKIKDSWWIRKLKKRFFRPTVTGGKGKGKEKCLSKLRVIYTCQAYCGLNHSGKASQITGLIYYFLA